ncbi:MAG TPA: ABC transporter permease [Mycobacterium sp.]|nr:ABC transporter permease [Mycobacterium sp.]
MPGILLRSAMTATAVAARRARDTLGTRVGESSLLSLGFSDRRTGRPHSADALLPNLDRTRTVGVVTLPGGVVLAREVTRREHPATSDVDG